MNTLYTVPTSNGKRASIALEECGIAYETRMVDLASGEHRSEEILSLNPFGRLPVLQLANGNTIYGSLAIGMHAARSSKMLLPAAPDEDAFHHWIGIIMTDLIPAFAAKFYLGVLAPEPDPWANDWYEEIITRFLGVIDGHLAEQEFFLSSGYSLADVMLYPTAATAVGSLPGGLDTYPNIGRWVNAIGQREAVVRGMAASS